MNGQCVTTQDGYYYVSAICMGLGVLTLVLYIMPVARRLEGELHLPTPDMVINGAPPQLYLWQNGGWLLGCNLCSTGSRTRFLSNNLSGYLENSKAVTLSQTMGSRDHFRASHIPGSRASSRKPESCTTSPDTATTILANYSLAQTNISVKWRLQPCTLARNGCANNQPQPRVPHRRISTLEARP